MVAQGHPDQREILKSLGPCRPAAIFNALHYAQGGFSKRNAVCPHAAGEYAPARRLSFFLCTRPGLLPRPCPRLSRVHVAEEYCPAWLDVEPRKPIGVRDWAVVDSRSWAYIKFESPPPLGIRQIGQTRPRPKGPSYFGKSLTRMALQYHPGQRFVDISWAHEFAASGNRYQ